MWSADQIDTLTNYWSTHSGAVIGVMIGKSRNAVIGKAHRMSLTNKKPQRELKQRDRKPKSRKPFLIKDHNAAVERKLPQLPPPVAPVEGGLSILELEYRHCRAVIGRGPDGLARYCGAQKRERIVNGKVEMSSFCPGHAHIYYYQQPA